MDFKTYGERCIWSERYKGWKKYHVKKPRMPNEEDRTIRWVDAPINKPISLSAMHGNHNAEIISSLQHMREQFDDSKDLPPSLIIYGPSGSGKTTIASKFTTELCEDLKLIPAAYNKFRLEVNAQEYDNYSIMWTKIAKFCEPHLERFITASFRIVVIDAADTIPPSQQQQLKRLIETLKKRVRWIIVCSEAKKMTTYLQNASLILRTHTPAERDALTVVLGVCYRNRIGYDRDGIHSIFKLHKDLLSLSKIIDFMQKIFLEFYFISEENVSKRAGSARERLEIPASEALQPIARCKICTLHPPCRHISEEELCERGVAQRAALPRVKGGLPCAEFIRYGHCTLFTKYGRCSLDHPKDYHTLVFPTRRCTQCTIPWPCNHCAYSAGRTLLLETIAQVQERLHLLKQLVVPDPIVNTAGYLNDLYPSWKSVMKRYGQQFITKAKEDHLATIINWNEVSFCQDLDEYRTKERLLRLAFGEMLETPMLDKDGLRKAAKGFEEEEDDGNEAVSLSPSHSSFVPMTHKRRK